MRLLKRKYVVALVTQGAWDTTQLSMPLALGYLKACALADDDIKEHFELKIFNYSRRASVSQMAIELFEDPPDILACSVLGWSFQTLGQLSDTFRQVRPKGWCIFGGNHVSYQAERVFRLYQNVDIVVNGEGEETFPELLRAFLAEKHKEELGDIKGISVRLDNGGIQTTPERDRLMDLDRIPSPFLTGAIPLYGPDGRFLYDVALMETNRGCPYKCAFCYWGGAIGQKLARFSPERVHEELSFFAHNKVEHVALCDANFGMVKEDLAFVQKMIELRAETTYPRSFVTSWAKNKSRVFYQIVHMLKQTGFHSDFTLSLQTLNDEALTEMKRRNMKMNAFDDLCHWLEKEGMTAHVELIWGLPGETAETFIEGYDKIADWHSRIATYPLCILPNTAYFDNRHKYNMVTVRDTVSDYEFVLSHDTITLKDNRRMHRFLFWARLVAEYQIFRHIWRPLLKLAGLKQSEVMLSLDEWFTQRSDSAVAGLLGFRDSIVENFDITRITAGVTYVHRRALALEPYFKQWWDECIVGRLPVEHRAFFADLFAFDWGTRPRLDPTAREEGLETIEIEGERFYGPVTYTFNHRITDALVQIRQGTNEGPIEPEPWTITVHYRAGFIDVVDSHEFVPRYVGLTRDAIEEEAERRRNGLTTMTVQPHVVGLALRETPALDIADHGSAEPVRTTRLQVL